MSTFVNQSGKNLIITCGKLCVPRGDLIIGSSAAANATISSNGTQDCCGLSVGQAYTQYGGWDKQIHVHGNRHSHMQATTNCSAIKMGIFAHCNWGGVSIGAVGTNSNHVVSMIVNNTHVGCWTSSCLYHVGSVKTPILCASSYSRAPYYCVNGQSDIRPFSSDGVRGIQIRSGCTSTVSALELVNNSGTWMGTMYSTGSAIGWLDSSWGNWDVKKNINGTMCVTVGSSGFICALEGGICATTCISAPVVIANGGNLTSFLQGCCNYRTFRVCGDADTFYPVCYHRGSGWGYKRYSINRSYNSHAPNTWYSSTHKGGLNYTWEQTTDTQWGGNDRSFRVNQIRETYTTVMGGHTHTVSGGIVWLRGGGADYCFFSDSFCTSCVCVYDGVGGTDAYGMGHSSCTYFCPGNCACACALTCANAQTCRNNTVCSTTSFPIQMQGVGNGSAALGCFCQMNLTGNLNASGNACGTIVCATSCLKGTKICGTANESINFKGARGCFTNEYMHLYNKVGIGHPGGWGCGEGNTPSYGLSTYGKACIGYGVTQADNNLIVAGGVETTGSHGITSGTYGTKFYSDHCAWWNVKAGGSSSYSGIKFRDGGGTIDGYVYADNGNIGFLDQASHWAYGHKNDACHFWRINNGTIMQLFSSCLCHCHTICANHCLRGDKIFGVTCVCSPVICATSEFQSCRYQHHWRSIAPGGDYDKFYPISFTSRGGQHSEDILEIAQSNVHANGGSCGAMYLKLGFNITGWGHINNHYVVYKYSTGGGNTMISKVRAIDHSTCRIGVWLRGGLTYYYRSREGTIACNITGGTTACCLSYDNSNNAYDVYVQYTSSVEDNNFNVSHNRLLNHHNSTGTSVMITSTNLQQALCCGCYANTIRLGDTTRIENQCILTPIVKATSGTYYINLNSGILNVPSVYANCIYNSSSTAVLGFTGGYTTACTCLHSPILCGTTCVSSNSLVISPTVCATSCVKGNVIETSGSIVRWCYPSNCGPYLQTGGTYSAPSLALKRHDGDSNNTIFVGGKLCGGSCVCTPVLCGTSCLRLDGPLCLTQSTPYICTGGAYIIVPGGIYVNGGTFYAENTTMHRNGICDDTATILDIWGGCNSYKCTNLRGKTFVCQCLYVHCNICLAPDTSGNMQNGISLGKVGGLPQAVWGESGSKTGRIEIGLPTLTGEGGSNHYGMVHVAIDVYEYNSNDATTIIVGGHNWQCRWYNCGAHITGGCTDKTIKVAYHTCGGSGCNGRYMILLGECNSTWSYGSVHVRSITNGLYYCNAMDMGTPWYVKRVTCADSHYNCTSADLRPGSQSMAGYQCAMVCFHGPRVCATTCLNTSVACASSHMNSGKFCSGSTYLCNGCAHVSGKICSTTGFYGDGSNLTGISAGGLCGCTSSTLTAVGVGAVASATGSNNTAVGVCSMNVGGGQYASWNTAVGMKSLCQNTGGGNTAVGDRAGECVCSASADNNVYMGSLAGYCARNGRRNTFLGKQAGGNALYGCDNIAIGYLAHTGSFGCRNVIIAPEGCSAQCLANSCNNIVIGYKAAHQHYSFSNCTFIGNSTMVKMFLCASTVCVCGSLSKTSGCFSIPHPDPAKTERYNLSHSFVESPTEGDNIYRYTVDTQDCRSVVELPDYYRYLNKNDQVWVSANRHFGVGYGEVTEDQKCLVICSCVEGSYNVLLIGTRKDKHVSNWKGTETIAHDRIRQAELEAKYGK